MSSFYIPKPCHENWNQMTPQEQGRHCAVCEKVVVDFSKKTHEEITSIINQAAEGSVCGHFNVTQLDQKAQRNVFMNPRNLFNRNWKYFALSMLGLFVVNKKAAAQGKTKMQGAVYRPQVKTNSTPVILAGTISNKAGIKLENAEVKITSQGRDIATVKSDEDGFYSIKIAAGKIYNNKITVVVNHYDYESKTVNDLAITKEVVRLNVVMDEYMMVMGKVAPSNYQEQEKKDEAKQAERIQKDSINKKIEQLEKEIKKLDKVQLELVKEKAAIENGGRTVKGEVAYVRNDPKKQTGEQPVNKGEIMKECILSNNSTVKTTLCEINMSEYVEAIASYNLMPADTASQKVSKNETGAILQVAPTSGNAVSVYPNPAGTYTLVTCLKEGNYKIDVYDEKGALQQAVSFSGTQKQLNTEALQQGIYFIRLSNENGMIETIKLVKE